MQSVIQAKHLNPAMKVSMDPGFEYTSLRRERLQPPPATGGEPQPGTTAPAHPEPRFESDAVPAPAGGHDVR